MAVAILKGDMKKIAEDAEEFLGSVESSGRHDRAVNQVSSAGIRSPSWRG